jgi:hypothetical protein
MKHALLDQATPLFTSTSSRNDSPTKHTFKSSAGGRGSVTVTVTLQSRSQGRGAEGRGAWVGHDERQPAVLVTSALVARILRRWKRCDTSRVVRRLFASVSVIEGRPQETALKSMSKVRRGGKGFGEKTSERQWN